jgi:hypothetical protein
MLTREATLPMTFILRSFLPFGRRSLLPPPPIEKKITRLVIVLTLNYTSHLSPLFLLLYVQPSIFLLQPLTTVYNPFLQYVHVYFSLQSIWCFVAEKQ